MGKNQKILIFVIVFIVIIILAVVLAGISNANNSFRTEINVIAGAVLVTVYFSIFGKKKNNNNSGNDFTLRK